MSCFDKTFRIPKFALLAFAALIFATLFCRGCLGVGINKYVLLGEYVLAFACLKSRDIEVLLAFSMPFAYGLPFNYIAMLAVVFIVVKRRELPDRAVLLLLLFLALLEMAMTFWYSSIDIGAEAGYVSCVALLALLGLSGAGSAKRMLTAFVVGTALAFLMVIQQTTVNVPIQDMLSGASRLGYGGTGAYGADTAAADTMNVSFNPNEVGYYSLVSLACGLLLLIKSSVNRILVLSCMAVSLFAGVLSQSRTWTMMVAALVLVQVILSIHRSGERGRAILAFAVVAAAAAYIIAQNPLLIDTIVQRFQGDDFASANGRTELLDAYNEWFVNQNWRVFFGTGVVNYKEITGLWNSMHNGFQQLYVCLGILGAAAFVAICAYACVRNLRRAEGFTPINLLPLIAAAAFIMSIQLVNPWSLMLPFSLAFVALTVGGEPRRGLVEIVGLERKR